MQISHIDLQSIHAALEEIEKYVSRLGRQHNHTGGLAIGYSTRRIREILRRVEETQLPDNLVKQQVPRDKFDLLSTTMQDYALPTRVYNTFLPLEDNLHDRRNIWYVGDLVQKTEKELLRRRGFGKDSLQLILEFLDRIGGLSLNMNVGEWQRPHPYTIW